MRLCFPCQEQPAPSKCLLASVITGGKCHVCHGAIRVANVLRCKQLHTRVNISHGVIPALWGMRFQRITQEKIKDRDPLWWNAVRRLRLKTDSSSLVWNLVWSLYLKLYLFSLALEFATIWFDYKMKTWMFTQFSQKHLAKVSWGLEKERSRPTQGKSLGLPGPQLPHL